MSNEQSSFQAGIDFESVLRIISKQVYETSLAFIRENVQNSVDAVRIQAHRDGCLPEADCYQIDVTVADGKIVVKDNGIGMTADDLRNYFWTMGASGKRTEEAFAAGCVGTFGIGGFANFGVCNALEVISQTKDDEHGTLTRLSESDIREAGNTIPSVTTEISELATPRGTVVVGYLREDPNLDELQRYLEDFARFVPVAVYFNGQKISQTKFAIAEERENYSAVGDTKTEWQSGDIVITGQLFEDAGHTLIASIDGMSVDGTSTNLTGLLRFENGPLSVFKHGFKLCATQIGTTIGVSGRLDCDRFVPTAGRDSLDSETTSLLGRIISILEKAAIEAVLETPERIAQHTRIFQYVTKNSLVKKLGKVLVRLADGSETTLGDIRTKANQGEVGVFFGVAQKQALSQIMQARGHLVVLLSSDRHRRAAERQFLENYCSAKAFDGIIDCAEYYQDLTRFEMIFLSELESTISRAYEVADIRLVPGKLTEDIPVFLREIRRGQPLEIFVDVRHPEITKLEVLGFTSILYSLISAFCHEYLGPSLKKWSPRFFGNGALNLELLSKRRSELWILAKDDIGEVRKGAIRQIVTRSDIQMVNVAGEREQSTPPEQKRNPRLMRIVDESGDTGLEGYYIRVPDTAFAAYGDLLQSCESRGLVWAGNKITFVASDTISAAFQYEIRLDELVAPGSNGEKRAEGAVELHQPLQAIFEGAYFPIPTFLESFLVPVGDREIRVDLHCDWIDMSTARHWLPRDMVA